MAQSRNRAIKRGKLTVVADATGGFMLLNVTRRFNNRKLTKGRVNSINARKLSGSIQ